MTRHVNRGVGLDGSGEDPDQADPADVGVRRRLDHFGEQWRVNVAGQVGVGDALWGEDLRQRMFAGRGEAPRGNFEQFQRADTGAGAHRDHRKKRAPSNGLRQILDQDRFVDLLATEVALHQRLILGLFDDSLDQGPAGLLYSVRVRSSGCRLAARAVCVGVLGLGQQADQAVAGR